MTDAVQKAIDTLAGAGVPRSWIREGTPVPRVAGVTLQVTVPGDRHMRATDPGDGSTEWARDAVEDLLVELGRLSAKHAHTGVGVAGFV